MSRAGEQQAAGDEDELVASLTRFAQDQEPIETTLRTDARVIARVTDGIYRQPGSALRELISNAYDADATRVIIRTDRPRFKRMVVEDNGLGMTPASLVHMLNHIGGSAKRTRMGAGLGVTSETDPMRSPGGRPLIGKIGIGLFSVAQLTQSFQVITKVAGDNHRTVASIVLKQYSDQFVVEGDSDQEYEAGRVLIWREPAVDTAVQGTTIVLDAIRPQTRDTLRSRSMWEAIHGATEGEPAHIQPPRYHIGTVLPDDESLFRSDSYHRLPWAPSDDPVRAFRRLVAAVWDVMNQGVPNPRLEQIFDYYLTMVWQLSLWAPLPYVDVHPFDLTGSDEARVFALPSPRHERELMLGPKEQVRDLAGLGDTVRSSVDFVVTVDDLELRRPIRTQHLPSTSSAVKTPLLFVAQERQDFENVAIELSGGPLEFQAYLLWAPKMAPTEHQGVLIRVHDATGTLFDPTFLRFPVAEQRRLSQICAEVFVVRGFDGAINIDRESFNFAHPHVVAITKWLHLALRRVIAVQKRMAKQALEERRAEGTERTEAAADRIVSRVWSERTNDDGTEPPDVVFAPDRESASQENAYLFDRRGVVGEFFGANWQQRQTRLEGQLEKIAQVLAAFNLLDGLSSEEQAELITAIREILQAYE
jgi:hypothetical protein